MNKAQTIAVVIILTALWVYLIASTRSDAKEAVSPPSETTTIASVEGTPPQTTSPPVTAGTEVVTMPPRPTGSTTTTPTSDSTTANAAAAGAPAVFRGENMTGNDEIWSLILINGQHPLPEDYAVKTAVVQGDYIMEEHAAMAMRRMLLGAHQDGVRLVVTSAYRSVEYQRMLFERYVGKLMEQGMEEHAAREKTAAEIAVPGHSEHNSGLAVDIVCEGWYMEHTELNEAFAETPEFAWLSAHCQEYGFILRYPKGKEPVTGIIYEPWHYRYVGVPYAEEITAEGVCLEEYLEGW